MIRIILRSLVKTVLPAAVAVAAVCTVCRAQAAATRYATDFQIWNDTQIIFPLDRKKDWNFAIWIIDRYGNKVRTVTDARIGGLLSKKVNKHVTLAAGYLYHYGNTTFVQPKYDSRFIGQVTLSTLLGRKYT